MDEKLKFKPGTYTVREKTRTRDTLPPLAALYDKCMIVMLESPACQPPIFSLHTIP
jgi:hypothetical protein